jgi:hypothetical protein
VGECPGQRHALLFPAGQPGGGLPRLGRQAKLGLAFEGNKYEGEITAFLTVDSAFGGHLDPANVNTPGNVAAFGQSQFSTFYNLIDAAVVIISIPIALLVLFAQRRIVAGLTAGSFR